MRCTFIRKISGRSEVVNGVKREEMDIFRHFEFINILHEMWHTYRIEGALSNGTKIIQTGCYFQGQTQGQT